MTAAFFPRDEYFMRLALREAERALEHDDVPVGCVVVAGGEVVAAARNEREQRGDPTAHAEILALREASARLGSWRLDDTVLYVTLEPCSMCAGAIVLARVPRVVFATHDPKTGAAGSVLNVLDQPELNHRPDVASGLLADRGGGHAAGLLRGPALRRGRIRQCPPDDAGPYRQRDVRGVRSGLRRAGRARVGLLRDRAVVVRSGCHLQRFDYPRIAPRRCRRPGRGTARVSASAYAGPTATPTSRCAAPVRAAAGSPSWAAVAP